MNLPKKYKTMIDEIRDERNGIGGGDFFVYLKNGFAFDGQHCFGAENRKEIIATMNRVEPCACVECVKEKA